MVGITNGCSTRATCGSMLNPGRHQRVHCQSSGKRLRQRSFTGLGGDWHKNDGSAADEVRQYQVTNGKTHIAIPGS
jgi:hypothetical protein